MKQITSVIIILALLLSCFCTCALAESAKTIQLSLQANPSTGYVWTAASSDEAVASIADNGFQVESDAVGSPGMKQLEIKGVSAGSAEITFSYSRPWEEHAEPMVSFALKVCVDEALDVALGETLEMSQIADSGYHWLFAQDAPEVLEVTESEIPGHYTMNALAEGTDAVVFGYLSPANVHLLWAFKFEAEVQDGRILVPSIAFYRSEDLDPFASEIPFTTTDREGNEYTDQIFAEHTLTIINFWEPWCGPCVSEMPALQKISEDYADKGVLILGVYSTPDMEEDVQGVLESTGVRYPILQYTTAFDFLQTGYVPTTVVVDSNGRIVKAPFSGAMSYGAWASLIEELL